MIALSWTFYLLSLFQVFQLSETKQKPPDSSHFSILDVTIGQDNLVALQSKLGTGKKCRAREHDGVEIVGYTDSKENLVFEFGEIGGGDVTAFYLSLPSRTTPCPLSRLSTQTSGLVTKGGVHLGMTEQEFVRIFGPPESRSAGGQWKYDWPMDAKYTDEEKKRLPLRDVLCPPTHTLLASLSRRDSSKAFSSTFIFPSSKVRSEEMESGKMIFSTFRPEPKIKRDFSLPAPFEMTVCPACFQAATACLACFQGG